MEKQGEAINLEAVGHVSQASAKAMPIVLYFGLLEVMIGGASYLLSDYFNLFGTLAVVSGILFSLTLVFCLFRPNFIKIHDMMALAFMLAYGAGTLNTWVAVLKDPSILSMDYLVSYTWLSKTLASVMMVSGLLHMVGFFNADAFLFKKLNFSEQNYRKTAYLTLMFFVATLILFALGKIRFMADTSVDGSAQLSAIGTLVLDMMTPMGALTLYAGLTDENKKRIWLFLGVSLFLVLVQFILGRRIFVFHLFVCLMTFIFVKKPKRLLTVKNAVIIICLVILTQIATTAFFTLRLASWNFKHSAKPSTVKLLEEGARVYQEMGYSEIAQKMKENVQTRTFVLEYLAGLSRGYGEGVKPLYGLDFAHSVIAVIPSSIYPAKYINPLFISEEELANRHFGVDLTDNANSLLTAGMIDFGFIGLMIYPIFFATLYSVVIRVVNSKLSSFSVFMVGIFMANMLLSGAEQEITGYLSVLRTMAIIALAIWIYYSLLTFERIFGSKKHKIRL